MKGLTADVQHQGDRCSIHLVGYLSSESALPLELRGPRNLDQFGCEVRLVLAG
jgi:hypothetical protein